MPRAFAYPVVRSREDKPVGRREGTCGHGRSRTSRTRDLRMRRVSAHASEASCFITALCLASSVLLAFFSPSSLRQANWRCSRHQDSHQELHTCRLDRRCSPRVSLLKSAPGGPLDNHLIPRGMCPTADDCLWKQP